MSQVNMRQVSVRGGQLPVQVQAGELPALVFLPYWGGSHRTFAPVIDRLAAGCAVVSYDHRGWGAARDLPGPYGISQLADDVLDVVRELSLRRYVLAGHSMGAKAAQLAASRRPDGLAGLVLIAPAPPRPAVDAQAAEALSHAYDSPATVSGALQHVLTHQPLPASLREQVITDSLAAGADARLAWPLHGITGDITAPASTIEVPVQVLAGQHDQVEPPASLEANLLPVIPGARMTIIEGTGHLSPLEVPGQIANQLDQFAASLAPARRWPTPISTPNPGVPRRPVLGPMLPMERAGRSPGQCRHRVPDRCLSERRGYRG
jgi:pimeloyl-ACP methyl ester carboxylesterase